MHGNIEPIRELVMELVKAFRDQMIESIMIT